jgi:hypothetical protein
MVRQRLIPLQLRMEAGVEDDLPPSGFDEVAVGADFDARVRYGKGESPHA